MKSSPYTLLSDSKNIKTNGMILIENVGFGFSVLKFL